MLHKRTFLNAIEPHMDLSIVRDGPAPMSADFGGVRQELLSVTVVLMLLFLLPVLRTTDSLSFLLHD